MSLSMDPQMRKRYGQICLVLAVLLNAVVLGIILYLSAHENELADNLADERYFMVNNEAVGSETRNHLSMQMTLTTHQVLRKLAHGELSPEDQKQLLLNEELMKREIHGSLRRAAGGTYLLASELPEGTTADQVFSSLSDEQLLDLVPKFRAAAFEYMQELKDQQVVLRDSISNWRTVYSLLLILSTVSVLLGNVLLYAFEEKT